MCITIFMNSGGYETDDIAKFIFYNPTKPIL